MSGLGIGVCALTLLLAVTIAYRGALTGSLLGAAVSVQIRGTDYVAVVITIILGVIAVADVLYLNIRDRAAELTTLRVIGWQDKHLTRLVTVEGIGMGLTGSVAGAALAVTAARAFAGSITNTLLLTATAIAAAGTLLAGIAAIVPGVLIRRLPATEILAGE